VYDVFLSFTRKGHPDLAARVHAVLEKAGIGTFIDESVPIGDGISGHLVEALRDSRLMVVVYSASYVDRRACQWELIKAYLVGAAEGDPTGRILVINPEPANDHIVPAAVADTMYLREDDLARLPQAVRAKLARLPGPMSAAVRRESPRWLPPSVPGAHGFVGRFPDLWRIHDALTGVDRPLTQRTSADPVAVLTGMAGIGKTSLVRAYAWLFDEAHSGGVYWTSVGGPGGIAAARRRFDDQVRALAAAVGIATDRVGRERIRLLLGEHLDGLRRPCLWVIDDLPEDATFAELSGFVVPSRLARHVFTTRCGGTGGEVARVALDGLTDADAARLLDDLRPIVEADRDAAATVVTRLGGHPLALRAAGALLEDQQGRMSYRDYAATLHERGTDDNILDVIRASVATLDGRSHTLLALAGLLAPAPVPADLIAGVEAALDADLPPATGDTLRELYRHGAASRSGRTWQFHPLAVEAAARIATLPVPIARVATEAASALANALDAADPAAPATVLLVRHAEALAGRPELAGADALRRLVAGHYEQVGDPARAATIRHGIAAANPGSGADQVAYALAGVANGEYARAAERARLAVDLGAAGDLAVRARWALAAALDGLGRFTEAEDLWTGLDRAGWSPDPAQRIAFDVARARAMIARGRLSAALTVLRPLSILPLDAYADQVNAARTELARLLLVTSSERRARELAAQVVAWYRDQGKERHGRCVEAELVWAEAALALDLFELRPDTSKWAEAEATLERLDRTYRETAVPDSVAGLGVAVLRGLVLVWLGKQQACRAVLVPAVDEIRAELGERHPLYLRARYGLSLAHLQLREHPEAAALLRETWQAQHDVLGPGHPDTLASQLEYGIALKFVGESKRSAALINDVCRRMPDEIGRKNDLYGRAQFAKRLLPVFPARILRGMQDFDQLLKKFQRGK